MKIKNVAIKNFRGYSDEINSDFEDLTAFVGKNDIGKSTILEALDIFFICLIRTACLKLSNVILMQVHQKFLFVRCIRRIRNVQTYLLKKIVILEK